MIDNKFFTSWYLDIKVNEQWAYLDDVFNIDECVSIINDTKNNNFLETALTLVDGKISETEIRKGKIGWLNSHREKNRWIFSRLSSAVKQLNNQFWNFDLDYIESLQFTEYSKIGDKYEFHIDSMYEGIHNRKLSFSVQLSDPLNYDDCDLEFTDGHQHYKTTRKQGSIIAFPSFYMHRVTKLSRGERFSLVGWVCGPRFK